MNGNYQIISLEETDTEKWSKFVNNHACGNIFQLPEMKGVYRRTKNYDSISLAAVDENGEILALMQACVIKKMEGFLESFTSRSIIQGGPLFVDNEKGREAVLFLIDEYNRKSQKCALYSEIRNLYDVSESISLFEHCGYVFEDHLNYLVDLDRKEKEAWMSIHRSMRKNIKKSQKKGVIIKEITSKSQIKIFYGFLEDVYQNAKMPLVDVTHFEAIFDILVPKGMAKFHLAEHEGVYIGGRVSLIHRDMIHAYFAGVPKRYKRLYPNSLLNWEIMRWGVENGYHTFDFGGAGKPNKDYGVRDFKQQFGGMLVNYGRYKKIHSPIKLKMAKKGFEIYRRIAL